MMKPLTIGELAQGLGVGVETIRYYEREGLIPEPPRKESGYRQYSQDAVARLHFIRRAKEVGFSLREIKDLLSLRVTPETTCGDIMRRAQAKIADIEERIHALQRMKDILADLALSCKGAGPASKCAILKPLDSEETERCAQSS